MKPFDAGCSRNVIDTHPAEDQTNAPHILVWMGLRTLIQQFIVYEDCVCRKTSFYGTISFLALLSGKNSRRPSCISCFSPNPFPDALVVVEIYHYEIGNSFQKAIRHLEMASK